MKSVLTNRRDAGYSYGPPRRNDQIPNPCSVQVSDPTYALENHFQTLHRYIPYGELLKVRIQVLGHCG